mgnify:CR=1 FL=1
MPLGSLRAAQYLDAGPWFQRQYAPGIQQLDSALSQVHIYVVNTSVHPTPLTLRERQTAATRAIILDAAFQMLTGEAREVISHELVATRAGASARTIYRHFPTQSELYRALWEERLRDFIPPGFPTSPDDIATKAVEAFARFDAHEPVIRILMASPAGMRIRDRGGVEGRAAFDAALAPVVSHLNADQRRLVVAVFVALFSSPYWQVLRDRAALTGPEAQRAVHWALQALLATLSRQPDITP